MKPYKVGSREERALVRELSILLPGAKVYRMPLSRGACGRNGDVLVVLGEAEFNISAKYGNQVPNWCYKKAIFASSSHDADVIVGPLWICGCPAFGDIVSLVPHLDLRPPEFVVNELKYTDLLCVRRRRMEWRVVTSLDTLQRMWRSLKEVRR